MSYKSLRHNTYILIVAVLFSLAWPEDSNSSMSESTSIQLTEEEKAWIKENPTITVSNEFDWPPFDFVAGGKPQGLGIDLMNLISKRSGITFKYITGYTWDELQKLFYNGEIDLLHSLAITPEREKKSFFSAPYYHDKNVLVLRKDTPNDNSLTALHGKSIALPRGWSSINFFKRNYPEIDIIEVENTRQALEYVDLGKAYATVEQKNIARYLIKKYGFHDLNLSKWIENDALQATSSIHFTVLKSNPILFAILSKALESITPGELEQLETKWFSWDSRQIGLDTIGLTTSEREYLRKKKTIRFCSYYNKMPMAANQDGKISGILADFIDIFEDKLEISLQFVPTSSWSESLQKVQNGECELLPLVKYNENYNDFLDFTNEYLNNKVAIITRDNYSFVSGLHDFSNKKVAIPRISGNGKAVKRLAPLISVKIFDNVEECLLKLVNKEVEAALICLPVATYHIRHMGLEGLKIAGYSGISNSLRIGVKKDEPQLHTIMQKLVQTLPAQEVDAVQNKWISIKFDPPFNYKLLWKILLAIAVFIILLLLWNWQLLQFNKQIAETNIKLEEKTEELKRISITDSLTGLYNRRYGNAKLSEELNRLSRYKHELSIILIDLDNFKDINDRWGHLAGDGVLQTFANILENNTRESDIVSRWGGEEFLIICPETNLEGAVTQAEHLRQIFASTEFRDIGSRTASFGVASYQAGETKDNLVKRADNNLYQAKHNGRNQVKSN